jgi:HEAT repeat protein
MPVLIEALTDSTSSIETPLRAAESLAEFGPRAKLAIPNLLTMLKSDYYPYRQSAAKTLGEIGAMEEKVIQALTVARDADEVWEVVTAANAALEKLRNAPEP